MKKIFPVLTLTAALIVGATNGYADDYPIQYIQSLTSFLPQLKKNANAIWPGFQVETKPLIVYMRDDDQEDQKNDSLYALDVTPQNPAWQKQIINDTSVYYMQHDSIGAHAYQASILKPYFVFENQLSVVFTPHDIFGEAEKTNAFNNKILAMNYYFYYEFFHSPYAESKWELIKQQNIVHDGFNKTESMALLFLEATVLKQYLETHNEEVLKDYAALFQYRYQLLDQNSQTFEVTAGEPLVEDYIAVKAVTQNDADFRAYALSEYVELPSADYAGYQNHFYDDALKFTHLVLEFGLDTVQPNWKIAVESSNTPPSIVLQQHYHFSDKEVAARVQSVKIRYGYAEISQSANALLTTYLQEMQALQTQYQQSADIEFVMNLPDRYNGRSEGQAKQYVLDSDVTLHIGVSKLQINAFHDDLNFDGKNMPAYYTITKKSFVDSKESSVVKFKLPGATKVIVDGKSDTLEHFVVTDKQVEFHQLSIEASGQEQQALSIVLTAKEAGFVLAVTDGKLQISMPKSKPNAMVMML
jgi:hypothetical protein